MKRKLITCACVALFAAGCGPQRIEKNGDEDEALEAAGGSGGEAECKLAPDCDDGDKCTIETCAEQKCSSVPVKCNDGDICSPVTGECVEPADSCEPIDDGDPCTTDGCDPDSGQPVNTPKSCDDENDATVDACDTESGDCSHTFTCGNCADNNLCTADGCNGETGECTHEAISCGAGLVCEAGTCITGPCDDNLDCNDFNPCSLDTCVVATGACEHRDNSATQCDDGNPSTRDLCRVDAESENGLGFSCDWLPTTCQIVDDRDECTVDACDESGNPVNEAISCDDGDASTDDACNPGSGICVYTPRCGPGTVFNQASGMCEQAESAGPDGCQNGDTTCRFMDGSWGVATCQNGAWVPTQQCPEACIDDPARCVQR